MTVKRSSVAADLRKNPSPFGTAALGWAFQGFTFFAWKTVMQSGSVTR
jgi:hypothetical protein